MKKILLILVSLLLLFLTGTSVSAMNYEKFVPAINVLEGKLQNYSNKKQQDIVQLLINRLDKIESKDKSNTQIIEYLIGIFKIKNNVLKSKIEWIIDYKWLYYFWMNDTMYRGIKTWEYEELEWVDVQTFKVHYQSPSYFSDKNYLYSLNWWYWLVKMDKSFIPIEWNFLKQGTRVYYNFVWLEQAEVPWLDPDSLKIGNWYFIKDKNGVYIFHIQYAGTKQVTLDWIDVDSFESITDDYFKDKNWVYLLTGLDWSYVKTEIDLETFREFQDWFMYDKNCLYLGNQCIKRRIDNNIDISFTGTELDTLKMGNKDFSVLVKYFWDKDVKWINYSTWNGSTGWTVMNKDVEKLFISESDYSLPWEYTVLIFMTYEDGTTSYNIKKLTVIK